MPSAGAGKGLRVSLCVSAAAIAGTFLCGKLLAQAVERSDWSIELVDPKVLRVCADPNNMPFSTERGEGFENKLAELLADKLGKGLAYSWYPQATGFVRNTLAAHKCDVIMGVPQGDDLVQVTQSVLPHGLRPCVQAGTWPGGRRHARRSSPQEQTHRHRGRDASRQQHGSQRSHG